MTAVLTKPKLGSEKYWAFVEGDLAARFSHRIVDKKNEVKIVVLPARIKSHEANDHKFEARITQQIIDRDREVVIPKGIMLEEFDESGAIHWAHDFDKPIGIGGEIKRFDDSLLAKGQFLERPANFKGEFFPDFARAFVTQMIKAGKRPGVSIGFEALESRRATRGDKANFGDRVQVVTSKANLLEWSIATVPANPGAFVMSVSKSFDRHMIKTLFEGVDLPARTEAPRETAQPVVVVTKAKPKPTPQPVYVIIDKSKAKAKRQPPKKSLEVIIAIKTAEKSGTLYA